MKEDTGTVFAWGLDTCGQLGDGTTTSQTVAVLVQKTTGTLTWSCGLSTQGGFRFCFAVISLERRGRFSVDLCMPNQRDIGKLLGISQTTISRALRGDPSISAKVRSRVRSAAKDMGYHLNAYVTALMSQVRSGQKITGKGAVGLLVNQPSEDIWLQNSAYAAYYDAVVCRSRELGFQVDTFFIQAPDMSAAKIDRILYARGIQGLILAPPYPGNRSFDIHWERYACVATGYGAADQQFDRVANDHYQNVVVACCELSLLGYTRIGMSLPRMVFESDMPRWISGFLKCQERLPIERRIPIFSGSAGEGSVEEFQQWFQKWTPDALLTLSAGERTWLDALGLRIPKDIGLACLTYRPGMQYAGVEERNAHIGVTAMDLLASKIATNQYGIPAFSNLILVEGEWFDGPSTRRIISAS